MSQPLRGSRSRILRISRERVPWTRAWGLLMAISFQITIIYRLPERRCSPESVSAAKRNFRSLFGGRHFPVLIGIEARHIGPSLHDMFGLRRRLPARKSHTQP